jgi:hypothetical protein
VSPVEIVQLVELLEQLQGDEERSSLAPARSGLKLGCVRHGADELAHRCALRSRRFEPTAHDADEDVVGVK